MAQVLSVVEGAHAAGLDYQQTLDDLTPEWTNRKGHAWEMQGGYNGMPPGSSSSYKLELCELEEIPWLGDGGFLLWDEANRFCFHKRYNSICKSQVVKKDFCQNLC